MSERQRMETLTGRASRMHHHVHTPLARRPGKPKSKVNRVNLKWAKPSRIYDHLYMGGAIALSSRVIYENRITFIINATTEAPSVFLNGVETMKIWVADTPETDLTPHFDSVADLIHYVHQNGGRALVHCMAGISRSASFVLAYLMKYKRMSLREAYQFLANIRHVVRPSVNFWHQLIAFEMHIRNVTRSSVRFVEVPGTDQMLPDVYLVTLTEEDEEDLEEEEDREPTPPEKSVNGSPVIAPRISYTRTSSDSPVCESESEIDEEKARDSGMDTEYEESGTDLRDASPLVNDVTTAASDVVPRLSAYRKKHLSGATVDSGFESANIGELS